MIMGEWRMIYFWRLEGTERKRKFDEIFILRRSKLSRILSGEGWYLRKGLRVKEICWFEVKYGKNK
jgi:hypothetical protein